MDNHVTWFLVCISLVLGAALIAADRAEETCPGEI